MKLRSIVLPAMISFAWSIHTSSWAEEASPCPDSMNPAATAVGPYCPQVEQVTIFGSASDVSDIAGGATFIDEEDLAKFRSTDVVRAMRQVPGVSFQLEDGFGLRPNISIRGTAAERSSRVTLLEDGVLIAPAPYTAPSAYYFPTFGRIYSIEVLKGPASITQGPYTVGGAINLVSTPIPEEPRGMLLGEVGSHDTWRVHGWYGGGNEQASFLLETHQWQSDGYQFIDRSNSGSGLEKQDYLAKGRFSNDVASPVRHHLDIKLQASEEQSRQSYLGLTDTDFRDEALRRYGLSVEDEMDNDHQQLTATWRVEFTNGSNLALTGYDNRFERSWYKTEGIDFDGSSDAQSLRKTSWSKVVRAINLGTGLGDLTAQELQQILDGSDTAPGAIQIRNNAREYASRGLQAVFDHTLETANTTHELELGLRYHEDEEDRLQRNDSYQQLGGQLVLSDLGLEGNAGNRIQDARAFAAYVHDRIEWGRWALAPGLRYESVRLSRIDYKTSGDQPGSRDPDNLKGERSNNIDIWIPGLGILFDVNERARLVAGVHKGFAVPGNQPGVDPEESVNFEFGVRYGSDRVQLDLIGFFNDYDNLVGVCTNSSGSDCEAGEAFNGEGVHVPGLELSLAWEAIAGQRWSVPVSLTYTWMKAEFQSSFESDFFGNVTKGDPVPYIPEHQALLSAGLERDAFAAFLSINYVDDVCTQARCGAFEKTEAATLFDLALHYRLNEKWELYAVAENLTDESYIAGREPYGARSNKPRSINAGVRFDF